MLKRAILGVVGMCVLVAGGEPVRSALGGQNTGRIDKEGWVNPYVTDGLIAMWDGEWNAGGGIHNADVTEIVDLSGNGHTLKFSGTYSIGDDYIYIAGTSGAYGYIENFSFGSPTTQDMCVEMESKDIYARFVGEQRGLCGYSTTEPRIGYLYGFGKDVAFDTNIQPGFGVKFTQSLTVGSSLASFYYKGTLISSMQCSDSQYSGTTYIFGRATSGRGMTGKIYNLRFYCRALTAAEIAYNYAIDKERFNLP